MANDDTPRDSTDLELDLMLDLEFLASNPSPEVAKAYAMDQLRAMAQRDARRILRRTDDEN